MSHNVTVKHVKIASIPALQAAIKELRQEGIEVDLLKNSAQRGYRHSSHKTYPYVIRVSNAKYDIALIPDLDGSGYTPAFDQYLGEIKKELGMLTGATQHKDVACAASSPQADIGKLLQRYSVCLIEQEARNKGLSCARVFDHATKQICVNVSGYN